MGKNRGDPAQPQHGQNHFRISKESYTLGHRVASLLSDSARIARRELSESRVVHKRYPPPDPEDFEDYCLPDEGYHSDPHKRCIKR